MSRRGVVVPHGVRGLLSRGRMVLGLALLLAACSREDRPGRVAQEPPAPQSRPEPGTPQTGDVDRLESSLRAVAEAERESPRDRWDPDYVLQEVGNDPQRLFEWVRDNTRWIPYRGVLRGPAGVLMDRQGNSLDRALLLSDLLSRGGHLVRLAHAELPIEQTHDWLPPLVAQRTAPEDESDKGLVGDVSGIAAGLGLAGDSLDLALGAGEDVVRRLVERLDTRVADQTGRLLEMVDGAAPDVEWTTRYESAASMLSDHWWVQWQHDGTWIDFDPLRAPGDTTPHPSPRDLLTPGALPDSLYHRVTVRVVAVRDSAGKPSEQRVLEHALRPAELIGRAIAIQFWPIDWAPAPGGEGDAGAAFREAALQQQRWSAALLVGSEVAAKGMLLEAAEEEGSPEAGIGGLGGGIAGALGHRRSKPSGHVAELTAVWLEYEIQLPGAQARSIRRAVFDLGDSRDTLVRSLSLMMRTDVLLLPCHLAPEFVAHQAAQGLLENGPMLRALVGHADPPGGAALDSLLTRSATIVGPLHALALARGPRLGGRDVVFVDRPTILTRHRFPAMQDGRLVILNATDIVSNDVGIALTEPDGFVARMDQGVFDTNIEAALAAGDTVVGNAAEAFKDSEGWRTLTAPDRGELDDLPLSAPARALLDGDLDSGFSVVLPPRPVGGSSRTFRGWWRVDPATGHTIGIGDRGWGQATDYSLMTEVFVTMAREFVWEYALCQAIPQVDNSLRIIGTEFWMRGWAPSWTRPPEPGKNVEEVAMENHRTCLIGAILQGYVATAPLLLMTMRYRSAVLMAERGGSFWRRAGNRGNSACMFGMAPSLMEEGRYVGYGRAGELPIRLAAYSGSASFPRAGGRAAPIARVVAPATAVACRRLPRGAPSARPTPGKGSSGPGKWLRTFGGGANMRGPEAAFQRKVSGRPANWGYFVKGTEFDGYRKGVLLDAKYFTAEGQFVKNQYYREWVKGPELLDQARTQVAKSGGATIEWHVPSKQAKTYLDQMMKANGLPIKVVVT